MKYKTVNTQNKLVVNPFFDFIKKKNLLILIFTNNYYKKLNCYIQIILNKLVILFFS